MIKEKFEILIVDDVKNNLIALNALLERDDVSIFQALNGTQALELMLKHDFCLALLDVHMPGMSGFELAEFMRGAKKTKNVPIIFVTATSHDQSFAFKGYESGAVDFLLKPLDPYAVKSKVNVFIELYRQKKEMKKQLDSITDLMVNLNLTKEEAERANNSKTQFLANMSHEIRTPLCAILGFIDLLKNPLTTADENRNYISIVERNSQQLLCLVDDILDLSKVEAGKMTIENFEFSFAEMLNDLITLMVFKAEEKGIQFKFFTDSLIPDRICSDPVRLKQILTNIIGNAIKFTDSGHVDLHISYSNSTLKFVVKDTGVGISKKQESRIFQSFSQADSTTTRKFGGTGLGLVLARRLSEALGGKLELVESKTGIGSTFLIEVITKLLPHAKLVDKNELSIIASEVDILDYHKNTQVLRGLKVLLVEDSLDNQMLITMYLTKEGAHVKTASDGARGAELALVEEFDVILMDIQMPILDGHQATKKLRNHKYAKPIVALTAHAMKEERIRCLESGFTDFLTKPIQRDLLIDVLSRYVPNQI
ncbi:MAG: response regulator [Pseudobdellovibrio sp.]